MSNPAGPIFDPRVNAVIDRLEAARQSPANGGPTYSGELASLLYADHGFSIHPAQGDLIYLLCRSIGAKRVVEFATSVGMSTLYFATAVRGNGGGIVIGSEIVPSKVAVAKRDKGHPFTAVPVFPRRLFSQSQMWVRRDSEIVHPRQLPGKAPQPRPQAAS
jgi:hypothetical protein